MDFSAPLFAFCLLFYLPQPQFPPLALLFVSVAVGHTVVLNWFDGKGIVLKSAQGLSVLVAG